MVMSAFGQKRTSLAEGEYCQLDGLTRLSLQAF
jgi:hypothetical protein